MDKGKAIELVTKYRKAVIEIFPDAITYLFGSHAKGCQKEDSDIDVAIVLPKLSQNYLLDDAPRLWRICADINPDIEPVMLELNENTPLYNEVMKHGILIK